MMTLLISICAILVRCSEASEAIQTEKTEVRLETDWDTVTINDDQYYLCSFDELNWKQGKFFRYSDSMGIIEQGEFYNDTLVGFKKSIMNEKILKERSYFLENNEYFLDEVIYYDSEEDTLINESFFIKSNFKSSFIDIKNEAVKYKFHPYIGEYDTLFVDLFVNYRKYDSMKYEFNKPIEYSIDLKDPKSVMDFTFTARKYIDSGAIKRIIYKRFILSK